MFAAIMTSQVLRGADRAAFKQLQVFTQSIWLVRVTEEPWTLTLDLHLACMTSSRIAEAAAGAGAGAYT